RAAARRMQLERRRLEASTHPPPVDPTAQQACVLYRRLLKAGHQQLLVTDKSYYARKVRHEFEVTARQTSARVRGIMYERGQWLVENKLGGI
nr:Chain XM, Complex1-LYR-like [Trypanosoma brucei]